MANGRDNHSNGRENRSNGYPRSPTLDKKTFGSHFCVTFVSGTKVVKYKKIEAII